MMFDRVQDYWDFGPGLIIILLFTPTDKVSIFSTLEAV
jgi:hypothetical protein